MLTQIGKLLPKTVVAMALHISDATVRPSTVTQEGLIRNSCRVHFKVPSHLYMETCYNLRLLDNSQVSLTDVWS